MSLDAFDIARAWASVLAAMKSAPRRFASIMLFMAFPPPPPMPKIASRGRISMGLVRISCICFICSFPSPGALHQGCVHLPDRAESNAGPDESPQIPREAWTATLPMSTVRRSVQLPDVEFPLPPVAGSARLPAAVSALFEARIPRYAAITTMASPAPSIARGKTNQVRAWNEGIRRHRFAADHGKETDSCLTSG